MRDNKTSNESSKNGMDTYNMSLFAFLHKSKSSPRMSVMKAEMKTVSKMTIIIRGVGWPFSIEPVETARR